MHKIILLILFILSIIITWNGLFALDSENIECDSWTWTMLDKGMDVAMQGDYAYIAGGYTGLEVIDISTPESLFVACNYDESRIFATSLHIEDNIAYVGAGEDGLCIVDISDPTSPEEISRIDTDNFVNDVNILGNLAYVADMEGGLKIVDISDPGNPDLIRQCFEDCIISGIFIQGNYLYLVNPYPEHELSLVLIANIRNPEHPSEVGAFYSGDFIEDICLHGDYAYITTILESGQDWGPYYFSIFNISDKRNPRWIGNCQTSSVTRGLTISGNYLYAATGCLGHYGDRDYACWGAVDIRRNIT
ncbi:MAG: hypothetical protein P9X24_08495 [Candidatus Hatepunaea meridiana]|nr:hypothetical protein [Candidatus Hatepunaea meridiana]